MSGPLRQVGMATKRREKTQKEGLFGFFVLFCWQLTAHRR